MLDDRVDVLLAISEIDRGCNFATGDVTHDYSTSESASVQRECGSKSPRQQVVRELPRRGSTRLESRRRWNFESARQEKKKTYGRVDRPPSDLDGNATILEGTEGKRRD